MVFVLSGRTLSHNFFNRFYHPESVGPEFIEKGQIFDNEVVKYKSQDPDYLLKSSEIIDFGDTQIGAIYTPEHLCFYFIPSILVIFVSNILFSPLIL